MNEKVIFLAAGGTGGHFFPAIALAQELKGYENLDTHIITDERCKKYLAQEVIVNSHIIDLYISFRSLLSKLKIPFSIFIALIKSFILILKYRPKVIIGFGGYPSFPLMLVGQLMQVPTVIHEQNSFLGKSNKLLARRAKIIALAYKNTKNLNHQYFNKTIVTGDLIRNNIINLKQKLSFAQKPFTLFVIGGSQGAKFFTELLPEAIQLLLKNHPETKLHVIQQVVKEDKLKTQEMYNKLKITYHISDFFKDINKHYEQCSLVIARSGASTIAELTQVGQPAIFIPYPYSADDHQYHNAKALADVKASWFYRQESITPQILADKLFELVSNPALIKEASLNLVKRKKEASRKLVDVILKNF